ncbi:hypothetical protein KHA90_23985 [Flavobacterium psychroterrae]|uniref:Uncharacterized protein n=1 Tax=Flavobacterium psychroterrae TaxID=2133767 RepID=A0ABS5PID5_9FLAO|nr:hypothetical protein [Flavobacterium psychroterrae]MBS7234069.1 hypothetical protein [Flavobacterium psychroterrae]
MKTAKHFTTSDGTEFYEYNTAFNHARTLEDKTIVSPGEEITFDIDVVDEEIISDTVVDTTDHSQIGAATDEPKIEIEAIADGSVNILKDGENADTSPINVIPLSADATKELIKTGGEEIKAVTTPNVETPKAEAKKENKPNTKN